MKYISLMAIVAIAFVIAWFILNPNNSSDYVVMVNDDISALEQELVAIEVQVQAGTLSPAAASEARGRIINRVNAIEASAAASGKTELTVGQRQQLSDGLERLKNILLTYQATLTAVEATAAADSRTDPSRHGNNGSQTLTSIVADTIDSLENVVEAVVSDYETDTSIDAAIDTAITTAELQSEEATPEEPPAVDTPDTSTSTSTEDGTNASTTASTTEETNADTIDATTTDSTQENGQP